MKEADIFPIEVDLTLLTLRGMITNDVDDNDDENDEENGNDLFHDEPQQENIFNQRQTVQDADLLNIGQ